MTRATATDVRAVIDTELSDSEISSYIEDANLEVEEKLAGEGLSDTRLKKIEKYLAAHFIRFVRERQVNSGQQNSAQVSFSGSFGEGLSATSPGQVVLETDTTGILGESMKSQASFEVF